MRTAKSKTYRLASGQREWVSNDEVIHYKDDSGAWQEIDSQIVLESKRVYGTDYAYRNRANSYSARFGPNAGGPQMVLVEYRGESIAFGPKGARQAGADRKSFPRSQALADMAVKQNCVTYSEVYPGVDLVYEPASRGVREYLVLNHSHAPNEFVFDLSTSGLEPKNADGHIVFVDDRDEIVFELAAPFAVDEARKTTNDVSYALSGEGKSLKLTVTLSRDYLADPARAFPVILDPDLLISSSETMDNFVNTSGPNTNNPYNDPYLRTGNLPGGTGVRRSLIKFDLTGVDVPAEWVDYGYLLIQQCYGPNPQLEGYRCQSYWSSKSVTWNTQPSYDSNFTTSTNYWDHGWWWRLWTTTPIKKWLGHEWVNFGWMLKDLREWQSADTAAWFYSSDSAAPHKPELHIVYTPSYADPLKYLASLRFDGPDWGDTGEKTFPMQGSGRAGVDTYPRLIKKDMDYNSDGCVDVEEAIQMYVPFATGSGIHGTTRDGHYIPASATVKADQRPAVYWQQRDLTGAYADWKVYQYWLYYPDNDWINNHEHDWEHYDLYFQDGVLKTTKVSYHNELHQSAWSDWVAHGLVEDGTHLVLSPQGGSHALRNAGDGVEDGVEIDWTGAVYSHGARLDMVGTGGWRIFSNDPLASGVTRYSQAGSKYDPSYYYYDDTISWWYGGQEWGAPNLAPWLRSTYLDPEGPY